MIIRVVVLIPIIVTKVVVLGNVDGAKPRKFIANGENQYSEMKDHRHSAMVTSKETDKIKHTQHATLPNTKYMFME